MERSTILTVVCLHVLVCQLASGLVYFRDPTGKAYGGSCYVTLCYEVDDFLPTCGYTFIIESSHTLYNVSTNDLSARRYQNESNIFLLDSLSYNPTLSKNGASFAIHLEGTFGNSFPNMSAAWFCYCDDTTDGACVPPTSSLSTPTTSPPITTTISRTSLTGSIAHLKNQGEVCMSDGIQEHVMTTRSVLACAALCLQNVTCLGVNYWPEVKKCRTVYDTDDSNPNLTFDVTGCYYYKVIWVLN